MAAERQPGLMTAEDFEKFVGKPDRRYELIDGEVVEMSPTGGLHGQVTVRATIRLARHVEPRNLGIVYAAETGFIVSRSPDRVRAPDVAFVARERLPSGRSPEGFVPLAPDFIVEVVSPGDTPSEIRDRIDTWLAHGVLVAWAVYPKSQVVFIHRSGGQVERRSGNDELDAETAVPGFRCKVSDLIPEG